MIEKRKMDNNESEKLISALLVLMITTVAVAVCAFVWSVFSIAEHSVAITRLMNGSFLQ